jgi:hypothetical protein
MLTDMDTIRYRISRGDSVSSKRILLTAIAKGDNQTRERILSELKPETLNNYFDLLGMMLESLRLFGKVEPNYLYQQVRQYVHTKGVDSQIEFIDRAWQEPLLTRNEIKEALCSCQEGEYYMDWPLVATLLRGDRPTQEYILQELTVDDFDMSLDSLFKWGSELYATEGQITRQGLYEKGRQYVINDLMRGYLRPVDSLFALEMPDDELIEMAIKWLKRREQSVVQHGKARNQESRKCI